MPRIMKAGATSPPMRGQATDSTGSVLNLTTALALEFIAISDTHTISGPATAIWPAIVDEANEWNWEYPFTVGETDVPGVYRVYLKVSWTALDIEYFPDDGSETLTLEAVD